MKLFKTTLCLLLSLTLFLPLLPEAQGDGGNRYEDTYFAENDWESLLEELFLRYEVDPSRVAVGYCNTVTGEEHFHQPDKYMIGASIYKVPLNMAFAEKVAQGELSWETPLPDYPYEYMMEESLIYSNNALSGTLMIQLGGSYRGFLNAIAPYLGVDVETVDLQYYNERYTARQYVTCLKTLCTEPERFPRIIETMQQAEPNNYFKYREQRFDIAHKYGYWIENGILNLNDVGIAYTDDPIVLVVLTSGVPYALDFMTEYCTLMCEYTQYHTAQRKAADAAALAEAKTLLENTPIFPALRFQPVAEAPAEPEEPSRSPLPLLLTGGLGVLSLALVFLLRRRRFLVWGCAGLLLVSLGCSLWLLLTTPGILPVRPEGDPQESVRRFFAATIDADYAGACSLLAGYSSLGLEEESADPREEALRQAMLTSYDYRLIGPCTAEKLRARQTLEFSRLDPASLEQEARRLAGEELEKLAQSRPRNEIYGEDGKVLPAVLAEATDLAANLALKNADTHRSSLDLEVQLEYREDRWLLLPDEALLRALGKE